MPDELRVFISSTFSDLQEEREYLVKKIFPEIRALCRERGTTFTEIDLRWGLTDEDVKLGQVIRACLEEVDRCRPYFIGITGSRYGYVPTYLDIQKDPALLEEFPWIDDVATDGMSITEMEAHYALLGNIAGKTPCDSAHFYFRRHRESFEEEHETNPDAERLEQYQKRIIESGASVENFRDPVSLGEMIYDDLVRIIKRDFAHRTPPSPLEVERARHDAFSLSRRRAYIPNPDYLKQLTDHVQGDGPPLIVYAESGSGKSSLFAYWADHFRKKNRDTHVIEHYVGIGATAADHYGVIRHICMEIKERFGREDNIPTDPPKLESALGEWLGYAAHELGKENERMVLILDGLNQLQGPALELMWLPAVIDPSIRLILSSTIEETLVELRTRGWSEFGMQALREDEREAIIVRYLAEYRKSLNTDQINRIAEDYKCGHPLFLKTLLEEIRLVSRHEDLDNQISFYLHATGTEDLFQKMLERIEEDHGPRAVRSLLSLIAVSRGGLDENEISEMSGVSRLKVTAMVSGLDYHLVRKRGYLTFFHDYLRRAVEKRYLSKAPRREELHRVLADYFDIADVTVRTTIELLHALEMLDDRDRLKDVLSQIDRFGDLWSEDKYEALRLWSGFERFEIIDAYRKGLEEWEQGDPEESLLIDILGKISNLVETVDGWEEAERLCRRRLDLVRKSGQRKKEAAILIYLTGLLYKTGRPDDAEELARESEQIYHELEDSSGISRAVGVRGIVHFGQGRLSEALECYAEMEEIARRENNRSELAFALGNRGLIESARGNRDEALAAYVAAEEIARELGELANVASGVGNRGLLHANRGEFSKALKCYEEQEEIATLLGSRQLSLYAVGNRGNLHLQRGDFDKAQSCLETAEQIAREIGDRRSLGYIAGNLAGLHAARGDFLDALKRCRDALSEHRDIGFRTGMNSPLVLSAETLMELVETTDEMDPDLPDYVPGATTSNWKELSVRTARRWVEDAEAISEELTSTEYLFSCQVLMARIDAQEDGRIVGITRLRELLGHDLNDRNRALVHYRLWKFGADDTDHRGEALRLFSVVPRNMVDYQDGLLIDELKAVSD